MPRIPPELDPEYFLQALEDCAVGVEITDTEGRFLYVNPAFERMSGYALSETVGRTPAQLLRSNVHPVEFYDEVMRVVYSGETWKGVIVSRRKDGSLFDSEIIVARARRSLPGQSHYLALRRDITEERRMIAALRESGERFRLAAHAARDGMWDWDIAGRRFYGSDRWFELHGEPTGVADMEWAFAHVHPQDRGAVIDAFDGHLAGLIPSFEQEYRLVRPDGEFCWVLCRGLAVRDPGGAAIRIAGSLTDISDRKQNESELVRAATHDALTGVPNRAYFVLQVEQAIARARRRGGPPFALLFIDLRRFKQVNDGYGHAVGDALLRAVVARLLGTLRSGDTLARFGGDEFAILLGDVPTRELASIAADRLGRSLVPPIEVEGRSLTVSATIGVALGDGSSKVDDLVRAADEAMYEARSRGDRGHHVAGPEAGAKSGRRARLATDLRLALRQDEIRVVYQPIVDMSTRRAIGAEALARWTHPEFGPVPPLEFVGIAEESGLGPNLGRLVLDKVAKEVGAWGMEALVPPTFFVNVNISARQLLHRPLVDHLLRLVGGTGLRRGRIGLEITETVLIERPEQVVETMGILRSAGVHFSLDDFGTGFSSLSHMRGFPVQSIKIDRSFVEKVADDQVTAQIVSGLVQMATALGHLVVAEGVETEGQARVLRTLGVGLAQGYLYCRPGPADQLLAYVDQQGEADENDAEIPDS